MPENSGNGNGKLLQRVNFTFAADIGVILAIISLCVWVGRQSQTIESLGETNDEQTAAIKEVATTTMKISGQVLQMSSSENMAEVERRVAVNEARIEAQENFNRELKTDMVQRLQRIEAKLDQSR